MEITDMLKFAESMIPRRVKNLLKSRISPDFLQAARGLPSRWRNVEHNKVLWDRYAKTWDKKLIPVENPDIGENERSTYLTHLGDEWGRRGDVDSIVEEYIYPFLEHDSVVAEIGVGGGRIASRV